MEEIPNLFDGFVLGGDNSAWLERAKKLQQNEITEFDEFAIYHRARIEKYRSEVCNGSPAIKRLKQIRAICKESVDFLVSVKNDTLYHIVNFNIEGFQDPQVFLSYKRDNIENLVREYCNLAESIEARVDYFIHDSEGSSEVGKINLFNRMPLGDVREYFRTGLCVKNGAGEQILTEANFEKFFNAAFLGQKLTNKIHLKLTNTGNGTIGSLFQTFYEKSKPYEETHHSKKKYIDLFTDHFDNWTEKIAIVHIRNKPNRPHKR